MNAKSPLFQFRAVLVSFITGLVISGVTAFPLLLELNALLHLLDFGSTTSQLDHDGLEFWLITVRNGLETTYAAYPWIAYGTDWLAFGHLVIAGFFVGPLINPRSGRSVIWTGIVACVAVIPLAMICGPLRGVPLYWRLIDCSFGVIGIVPLIYCLRLIKRIEAGKQ